MTWVWVSSTKRLHPERRKYDSSWRNRDLAVIFSMGSNLTRWFCQAWIVQVVLMLLRFTHTCAGNSLQPMQIV